MDKKTITISLLAVAVLGGFLILYDPKTTFAPMQNISDISGAPQMWETRIDEQAGVTVSVTPTFPSPGSKEWTFNVVMNTHSVELDQDMTKVAILIDEQGNEYKALKWDGPDGSHHREGVLIFGKMTPAPRSIELRISGIGGVVRSFTWQL
jgi:hypothetical protein